ncbi:hypothetical protein EDB80DRAFT_736425 [Ilyonectria destructans]|nr:hypothetical protein EDB80DRAFT_736425 [Ilyonectria destructans]
MASSAIAYYGMSSKYRKVTPPERTSLPTPPASTEKLARDAGEVMKRIRTIWESRSPLSTSRLAHFSVSEPLYLRLKGDLEQQIRAFDYDPSTSTLVVRMPSYFHDTLATKVSRAIERALERVTTEHVMDMMFIASHKVEIEQQGFEAKLRRYPDAFCWHNDMEYPGVVLEVSYSQRPKELEDVAEDYILKSCGMIQVVIGLDVAYNKRTRAGGLDKTAVLYVWRSETVELDGKKTLTTKRSTREVFRDEGGNIVNPEKKLEMTLSDFAPSDVLGESSSHPVALTHEQLFHLVEASEARHQMLETRRMRLQVTDEMREMPQKKRERTPDCERPLVS